MTTDLKAEDISICGAAKLVAAIFGESEAQAYKRLGLNPPPGYCWQCGLERAGKTGLCHACWQASLYIQVACSYCGALKKQSTKHIIHYALRGYEHFFCNSQCMGKYNKANGIGRKRRFDWDMVWQKHLETGYGPSKLARELGMNASTVSRILKAKRKEGNTR